MKQHSLLAFVIFAILSDCATQVLAEEALRQAEEYLAAGVPVGRHLADQLMLPLGIDAYSGFGGGVFRTTGLSLHSTTQLEGLRHFLEIDALVDCEDNGNWPGIPRESPSERCSAGKR